MKCVLNFLQYNFKLYSMFTFIYIVHKQYTYSFVFCSFFICHPEVPVSTKFFFFLFKLWKQCRCNVCQIFHFTDAHLSQLKKLNFAFRKAKNVKVKCVLNFLQYNLKHMSVFTVYFHLYSTPTPYIYSFSFFSVPFVYVSH